MTERVRAIGAVLALLALGCVQVGSRPAPPPEPAPEALTIPPGVVVNASTVGYKVEGTDIAEIGQSLRDRTPLGAGANRHHGSHSYSIRWSYRTHMAEQCTTDSITVTIASRIMLPAWDPPALASRSVRATWQYYISALARHELGHRTVSITGAIAIRDAIARVKAERCAQIAPLVAEESQRILAETREANTRYDLTTNHGESQGARWPPQ